MHGYPVRVGVKRSQRSAQARDRAERLRHRLLSRRPQLLRHRSVRRYRSDYGSDRSSRDRVATAPKEETYMRVQDQFLRESNGYGSDRDGGSRDD